ncbi:SDR family NAD(P)-dependent oxidoreductase [Candidatus Bathyarchaeota archaeon]|nr:SDR family NAD(P)-dependent oxidoreductase [Candidatus Bathyarchaeota archaeon]
MKTLVTGGAGFIGSHIVDRLMNDGYSVIVVDDLSSGHLENVKPWLVDSKFRFVKCDLKEPTGWAEYFEGVDVVFHYAANPEVRVSVAEPRVHFDGNLQATFNVLEACRLFKVPLLLFASTSTVYGDAMQIPTLEDYTPLKPISVYGAIKLACETLISTYSRLYGLKSLMLRYANVVGPRMRHGVVVDFVGKLKVDPRRLEILGDGSQRKSYLYVEDAVEATLKALDYLMASDGSIEVFNVGSEDWISVREIADIVVEAMGLRGVEYVYKPATSDGKGWLGDVKYMLLDISRLKKATDWRPRLKSREAVWKTVESIL